VVGSSASNVVSVLLNNGDGTFRPAPSNPSAVLPFSPALGDFAHRGVLDLAVGEVGTSTISVQRGNGDGTFGAPVRYRVGLDPWWVSVSDLRHNGTSDILVAIGASASISVLLGQRGRIIPARGHLLSHAD
jgi:hypothetical protein